jgi:DNA-binding CsgD family transcriptional regulator
MILSKILTMICNADQLQAIETTGEDYECNTYIKDAKGNYITCNENQARIVGLMQSEQMTGLTDYDVYPEKEAAFCRSNDEDVMRSRHIKIINEPFTSFSGKSMIATSIKTPLRTKENKIIGISGISILQPYEVFLSNDFNSSGLTHRQLECLLHLVKGKSMKQIGKEMLLSHRTVEHYLENIKLKLVCDSRVALIEKALTISYIRNRL